jgi:leucyl aminopeptidase
MQIRLVSGAPSALTSGSLVVGVFSDGRLDGAAQAADKALDGAVTDILTSGEIKGEANETALVHAKGLGVKRVLVVGLGERKAFDPKALAAYAGTAVRYLGKRKIGSVALTLPLEAQEHLRAAASALVEGAIVSTFEITTYRTDPESEKPAALAELLLVRTAGNHEFNETDLQEGIRRGKIIGEALNYARILAVTPANDMTPAILAQRAQEVAKQHDGLHVEIIERPQMEKLGMGSLLSVARGSEEPPKLIVFSYNGDPKSNEKLALVGKGVTFDSGGISIKPSDKMEEMKYDMCGAAAVIATMGAIAQLKPKINVIGLAPATENLPSGKATKPGDIVKAMNGKTIEVINTDAEGRLILADALAYACTLGATKIIDAATLTGAMVVALGHAATGTISNDDAFAAHFLSVANETCERYWHLPLYDEFSKKVKSEIADLRNSTGREAGSLTAAAFLKAFIGETPWIHLDIAGTAYVEDEKPYRSKGPTGAPVRAFIAYVEALASGNTHTSNAKTNGAKTTASV